MTALAHKLVTNIQVVLVPFRKRIEREKTLAERSVTSFSWDHLVGLNFDLSLRPLPPHDAHGAEMRAM